MDISKLKELIEIFEPTQTNKKYMNEGFCLVVLDRGFIYLGDLEIQGDWCILRSARNLRSWSSGKGLQWHIENGKENTTLDGESTNYYFHVSKLNHYAQTDKSKWQHN